MLFSQSALLSCSVNVFVFWLYNSDMQVASLHSYFFRQKRKIKGIVQPIMKILASFPVVHLWMRVYELANCHYDEIILVYDLLPPCFLSMLALIWVISGLLLNLCFSCRWSWRTSAGGGQTPAVPQGKPHQAGSQSPRAPTTPPGGTETLDGCTWSGKLKGKSEQSDHRFCLLHHKIVYTQCRTFFSGQHTSF